MKLTFILSLCCCLLLSSWSFRAKRTKGKITFQITRHAREDLDPTKTIYELLHGEHDEGTGELILDIDGEGSGRYLKSVYFSKEPHEEPAPIGINNPHLQVSYEIHNDHYLRLKGGYSYFQYIFELEDPLQLSQLNGVKNFDEIQKEKASNYQQAKHAGNERNIEDLEQRIRKLESGLKEVQDSIKGVNHNKYNHI
jgi:hypothetical protein